MICFGMHEVRLGHGAQDGSAAIYSHERMNLQAVVSQADRFHTRPPVHMTYLWTQHS